MVNTFGETVKRLRLEKGWNISELARRSGVGQPSVGIYERGDRIPNVEYAEMIATSLGVTIDYLMKGGRVVTEPVELTDGLTKGFKLDGKYINIPEQRLLESVIDNIRHNRKEKSK